MKSTKKVLAILLIACMSVASFSGCTNTKDTTSEKDNSSDDGKIHPVRIVQPGTLPVEYDEGIAAVNEKLKEDGLNIEVSVQKIPWDTYDQKLNLMLNSGEPFEILHVMQDVKNLTSIASMGALESIDEILEKYPDLVSKFTDVEWQGTLYNGKRYAVPCSWKPFDYALSNLVLRTDVMKKVGYETFPDKNVDDMIDLMKKSQDYILDESGVKAYHWIHQVQSPPTWLFKTLDTYPFMVESSLGLALIRQDGSVDSFYESEEFKQCANIYQKMYQDGLINPDVLSLDSQVKQDQAKLGAFLPSKTFDPGCQTEIRKKTDLKDATVDWVVIEKDKPELFYTYCQNINAISSTAENPESGIQFLDWLYKTKENHDLFHYGTEGKYFTAVGDNKMDQTKGEDGNALYYMETWMTGYSPYIRFASDTPDAQIDYMTATTDNYTVSPAAGFNFDATKVSSELTNLQTEIMASIYPIKFGMVPYEGNIDKAIDKLKAAGLDRYLEEYRSQFKAYLDANPQALEMAKGTQKAD